jgi:hypothetical protein
LQNKKESLLKKDKQIGIKIAKAQNKHLGRPKAEWRTEYLFEYKKWINKEQTAKETMNKLGLKSTTFYKLYKEYYL